MRYYEKNRERRKRMKRVWGFILTFILILNTVITPGISARAQNVVGAMSGVGMQAADNEIGAASL